MNGLTKRQRSTKAAEGARPAPRKRTPAPTRKERSVNSTQNDGLDGGAGSIRDQVIAFKREQIINAAVDLFYDNGYQRTTLDAVAERLGVTKPFIYYHFKDKEEILAEISRRSIAHANDALEEALATTGRPSERLYSVVRTITRSTLKWRRYTAIFFREQKNLSEQARQPLYSMHRKFDGMLTKLLEEGVRTGEFRVTDPALTSLALAGMIGWAYNWYRPEGRLSVEDICDRMAEMALNLVGAKPERSD